MSQDDEAIQRALDELPNVAVPGAQIETVTPQWTQEDIASQLRHTAAQGWVRFFEATANDLGFSKYVLLAIASRESNISQIVGDHGHGHGIMQIDDRYFPDFIRSGDWQDPQKNIEKGGAILKQAYTAIQRGQGKNLTAKIDGVRQAFVGAQLCSADLLRTAIAAYNAGGTAYYYMSVEGDPDAGATPPPYSRDVLRRQSAFESADA